MATRPTAAGSSPDLDQTVQGRLLDLGYRITCDEPATAAYLRWALRDSAGPAGRAPTRLELRTSEAGRELLLDGESVLSGSRSWVLANLFWRLNRLTVEASQRAVLLHAGAVERDGAAVIIVGPSGAGKTVTSLGLARCGFSLLSDDIVRLTQAGRVDGSPKPVGLREGGRAVLSIEERLLADIPIEVQSLSSLPAPASALDVRVGESGLVRAVVFLDPDRPDGALAPVGKPEALARLAGAAFALGRDPTVGFEYLGTVVRAVATLAVGRRPPAQLSESLAPLIKEGDRTMSAVAILPREHPAGS